MALRPSELQIILAATRDIERVQHVQQQHPRSQQEQLALQFQHEVEQRKRQTQATVKAEQAGIRKIELSEKKWESAHYRERKNVLRSDKKTEEDTEISSSHIIDLLI